MLTQRLAKRKQMEALTKVSDYRIQLQIATASHTRDGAGVKQLFNQFDELEKDINNPERISSRKKTRDKLNELLLKQAEELAKEG